MVDAFGPSRGLEPDDPAGRAEMSGLYVSGDPDALGPSSALCGITAPTYRAVPAAGPRAPRRAADASVDADPRVRHSWRATGPRNVTGRVRALASDPRDPSVLYAGTASGGVYKTTDGGERWLPLWHDQPSLAVGTIGVATTSPADPARRRVYAATGEIFDNGFAVPGHGIWVSDDAGATWTNHSAAIPPDANPAHRRGFDAIAVDPADDDHCWAVGEDGIFRTVDGGSHWDQLLAGTSFSDVAFSAGRIYLARATSVAGEAAVLRLDPPASTPAAPLATVTAALASPNALSVVVPAVPLDAPWPARAKLAVAPSAPSVAYVRIATEDDRHLGIFRSRNAQASPARTMTWTALAEHHDFVEERQGTYDLCLAVSPADANQIATGMVNLHVSTNANATDPTAVTWRRAIDARLGLELRGNHADNHQVVFLGTALWVANDGGIARSDDWITGSEVGSERPLAPGSITFRRRDSGIEASQAYDLNQSPLVRTMYAAGFQDNGVYVTGGGPTWRNLSTGDGGFVVFDPDDPFRLALTTQGGIDALQFPGHLDRQFPAERPPGPLPQPRRLLFGFREVDKPAFVADTDRHPLDPARMLHTRTNRVYGTKGARGERWDVEGVGTSFEIVVENASGTADVEVLPTDGAIHLGLLPQRKTRRVSFDPLTDPGRAPAIVRVASRLPAPYRLVDGDEVRLRIDGAEHVARFSAVAVGSIDRVTLAEVLRTLRAALPKGPEALPRMWPQARAVEIITRGRGPGEQITIGGSALAPHPDGLSRLGLNPGIYRGDDDRPASITIGFEGIDDDEQELSRNLSGTPPLVLTVSVGAGPARSVTFRSPAFADPSRITAGELEAALQAALAPDANLVDVVATEPSKALLLDAEPGHTIVVRGTAADRLGIAPTSTTSVVIGRPPSAFGCDPAMLTIRHQHRHRRNFASVDLTPPGPDALELEITDGVTSTGPLPFTAVDVADLRCVTVEELHRIIRTRLAATPGIQVRAELSVNLGERQASELRFSAARPGEAWVGGCDGRVFLTPDDGVTWAEIGSPDMRKADARIEAVALHPTDEKVAYVGLWRRTPGPADRPLLFRTTDGGTSWQPIGSARVAGVLGGIVSGGVPASIYALELDPGDPSVVLAATEAGVFRSADGGGTWAPFNEGLPNCRVVDLATVPGSGSLRASLWGRGSWERSLGREPPDDVRLNVRANELDDGSVRPSRLAPRLFADAPGPDPLDSPDIKMVRRRPSGIGADPNVDGVEFDLEIRSDEVVPGQASEILVQVHNRGAFAARSAPAPPPPPALDLSVRAVVLWAPVSAGLPDLPLDFWGRFKAGAVGATEGDWSLLSDSRLPGDLRPDRPEVLGVPVAWPDPIEGREIAILVLVTATDDVLDGGPVEVAELVRRDRRAALRRLPVRRSEDDRTLLLRSRGRRFQVEPPADPTSMVDRLRIAPADVGSLRSAITASASPGPTYDLSGPTPGLLVAEEPVDVDVEFHNDQGEFADIAKATPAEVARFIDARLATAGVAADAFPVDVGIRLRALGGALVRITGGSAVSRFPGWAVMSVAAAAATIDARNVDGFDLTGDRDLKLEVRAQANHAITLTFPSRAFQVAGFADASRIALLINQAIGRARLDGVLRCDVILGIAVRGRREALVSAGGAAAATLSIPAGPAAILQADPGETNLGGRPHAMFTFENRVTVRFDRDPGAIPAPAAAAPPDVRRVLNEAFEVAEMDVRAEVPFLALSIRASGAEGAAGSRTGGGHLAEIATSGTGPAPDPAALFDVRTALGNDTLKTGGPNQLYVRLRNAGNVEAAPARLRLFRIDPTVSPVGIATPPAVETTQAVAAEASAIANAPYTPTAPAGQSEHLLAVVDQDIDGRRVALSAFPDLLALVAYCESRPDVAMRTFEVAT